ncbi:MAG: class II aldolase/adducin family protein [Candidatus Wallbacteria bacterium]|nr:class II aldolase/adducin family protein [Candidatus Wallbacteria bacterium]
MADIRKELAEIGHRLFLEGLNHSHSGNLSIRQGDTVFITRTGSQCGFLTYADIVGVNLNSSFQGLASMEYVVHRSIYLATKAAAIVHCHSPHTVALSFNTDRIVPVDAEGKFYFREIPVLSVENAIASAEVAEKIPLLFQNSPLVVVRSHGVFSSGKNLEEAYKFASSLEASARIIMIQSKK